MRKALIILFFAFYSIQAFSQFTEEVIGYTYFDQQSAGSMGRQVSLNADGTISAVWTFQSNASFADTSRIEYSFFNGTYWNPSGGINGKYKFPVIGVTHSNREIILARNIALERIEMISRTPNGIGPWVHAPNTFGNLPNNDCSPRMAVAGDTIHVIWQSSGANNSPLYGQYGPILYSRSFDGGNTWNIVRSIITEIDSNSYRGFSEGAYSIDASGAIVVIAFAGKGNDVGILKSTDAGATWTKTIIDSFPISMYDETSMITDTNGDFAADTINSNGGDPCVLIDHNGIAHVWFSSLRVYCSSPGLNGLNIDYFTDGLKYWNENSGSVVQIASAIDFNANGIIDVNISGLCSLPFGNYHGGMTQKPTATIDQNGTIAVAYQSIDESADMNLYYQAHRHIYAMTTTFPYQTWSTPVDILPSVAMGGNGDLQEGAFPSFPRENISLSPVSPKHFILYQRDEYPGNGIEADSGSCDRINNDGKSSDIVFENFPTGVGIQSIKKNFDVTIINSAVKKFSFVYDIIIDQLSVYTIDGKKVISQNNLPDNSFNLDMTSCSSGIYFIEFASGDHHIFKKAVVQ